MGYGDGEVPGWADRFPDRWRRQPCMYQPDDIGHTYGDAVRDALARYDDGRILDLGSGGSTGVAALTGDRADVVHLDYRRDRAELSHEKGAIHQADGHGTDGAAVHGDARALPFRDDAFDVVFAGASLSEAGGGGGALTAYTETEIPRVLAPAGDLLVVDGTLRRLHGPDVALAVKGMDHLEDAYEEVRLDGRLLAFEGYHPDADPRA